MIFRLQQLKKYNTKKDSMKKLQDRNPTIKSNFLSKTDWKEDENQKS